MNIPDAEPFNPATDCHPSETFTDGTGRCGYNPPCLLRCQIRFLDGQFQPNDGLADQANADAWRRYYDVHPGAEAASRAACDLKTYEEKR